MSCNMVLMSHTSYWFLLLITHLMHISSPNSLRMMTVYGALHGLQTFSQLCQFNLTSRMIEVGMAPWNIADQPRFSYRGLLIDTGRHYQPLPIIKKVIDYGLHKTGTYPTVRLSANPQGN